MNDWDDDGGGYSRDADGRVLGRALSNRGRKLSAILTACGLTRDDVDNDTVAFLALIAGRPSSAAMAVAEWLLDEAEAVHDEAESENNGASAEARADMAERAARLKQAAGLLRALESEVGRLQAEVDRCHALYPSLAVK